MRDTLAFDGVWQLALSPHAHRHGDPRTDATRTTLWERGPVHSPVRQLEKVRAGLRSDNRIGLKLTKSTDANLFTLLAKNLKGSGITVMVFTITRNRHASYSLYWVRGGARAQRLELYFQHCRFEAGGGKTNEFSVDTRLGVVVHGSKARNLNFPSWVLQGWIWVRPDR